MVHFHTVPFLLLPQLKSICRSTNCLADFTWNNKRAKFGVGSSNLHAITILCENFRYFCPIFASKNRSLSSTYRRQVRWSAKCTCTIFQYWQNGKHIYVLTSNVKIDTKFFTFIIPYKSGKIIR